jgi:predicted RNase H-like nuclease (RuvC/YqgF family)
MSKTREQGKIPPPPLDKDGNLIVVEDDSNTETSMAPTLEELMRRLEELTTENKKLKAKAKNKKTKGSSSSSEEEDSSFEEDVFKKEKKGRRNRDKPSYNSMSFNYNNMPSSTAYTSILIGKAQYFDGTSYNQWKHCMKNYLYSISSEVW